MMEWSKVIMRVAMLCIAMCFIWKGIEMILADYGIEKHNKQEV